MNEQQKIHYTGFNRRVYASAIDTLLMCIFILPLYSGFLNTGLPPHLQELVNKNKAGQLANQEVLNAFSSYYLYEGGIQNIVFNSMIDLIVMGAVIIIFWIYRSATPGKILFSMKIVDAKTLEKPSNSRAIIRYLSYFISSLPLFLGFIWIAFDKKKQGWHDKIAGTLVIDTKDLNSPEEKEKRFRRQTIMVIVIAILMLVYAYFK